MEKYQIENPKKKKKKNLNFTHSLNYAAPLPSLEKKSGGKQLGIPCIIFFAAGKTKKQGKKVEYQILEWQLILVGVSQSRLFRSENFR
jgi:hypothetical protein